MVSRAAEYPAWWDIAAAESVEASQQWILTAMQKHGPALVSMLWRILGHEQDVCDAYQDTFLQLAHLPDRRKPEHIKAYLFRTASNVAISFLRRRRVHENACQELAQRAEPFAAGDTQTDLDAEVLRRRLREHIERLPDYLREVILLRDLGELPYNEVASTLGISSAAARVYRHRAVQLLALWMAGREVSE
jgi:RNA polymerase sigma-70 factor, ECF subfamily